MASTFTPNKGYEQPARGEDVDTWDVPVNGNMSIVDKNQGGNISISMSNTDITLTSDQAQNFFYYVTGTLTANVNLIFPQVGGYYCIYNQTTGPFSLGAKSSASGAISFIVNQGFSTILYCNSSFMFACNNDLSLPANSVSNAALAQVATQTLKGRASGGTGNVEDINIQQALNFLTTTQGSIPFQNGSGWTGLAPGTAGQFMRSGGAGANPVWGTVPVIPSQTGFGGRVLATDGTNPYWSSFGVVATASFLGPNPSSPTFAFNMSAVATGTGTWQVTLSPNLPSAAYAIAFGGNGAVNGGTLPRIFSKTNAGFIIRWVNSANNSVQDPQSDVILDVTIVGGN